MSIGKQEKQPGGGGGALENNERYVLRLYVSGLTPNSIRAIANLKALCEERLAGRYELEVIDVFQQPELARADQIVAVPTLIKALPLPMRRLLGDLSKKERVLVEFELQALP
ncbi:MAG: circadian clock KaiB family protein [Ramlibacter sp.]